MEQYAFTARQVQALTGITRPALGDLVNRDIVVPTKHRGTGRGDNHLFDIRDLFGLAVVEFLRPKADTNDLLQAAFAFWHTTDGRRLLEAARGGGAKSVVVFDSAGHVTIERDMPISALAARRKSALLHVVEPNALAQRLFHDVALYRMAGDHAQPNPSGREPRPRESAPKKNRRTKAAAKKRVKEEAQMTPRPAGRK